MSIWLIFLIGYVVSQADRNRYIISLSGNSTNPSDYISALEIFNGGIGVDSEVSADSISVNKINENSVSIQKTNGDVGIDLGVISNINFQNEGLSHEKFYTNYTYNAYPGNKIHNSYLENTYDSSVNDYQVACDIKSNPFNFNITTAWNSNITKIVTYSYASFGLIPDDKGAYYITYKNSSVNVDPLVNLASEKDVNTKEYLSNKQYADIWIINQPYDNRILLALQEKGQNNFYFFNINLLARSINDVGKSNMVEISFYTDISLNQNETYVINNIGIHKNDLLIGSDKGLYVLRKGDDLNSRYQFLKLIVDPSNVIQNNNFTVTNSTTTDGDTTNTTDTTIDSDDIANSTDNVPSSVPTSTANNKLIYLTGFAVNQLTVYAIFFGYGMVILDPTRNYEVNKWVFKHPSLNSVDFINNPYLGNKYSGITVKNQNDIKEFFIELLIDDEFKPVLNKVHVSDNIISADNALMVDLFYTYIFNKVTRQLIIIRRGLLNAVTREIVVFDIERVMTLGLIDYNPIISLYDFDRNRIVPVLPFTTMFYIINDIIDTPNTLTCSFQKSGNYTISYLARTELCQPSIASTYVYSFCQKTISLRFNVIGADTSDYDILIGVFVTVFGLILIVMIAWLLRKTNCCTSFKAFRVKKQSILDRADLYIDIEPERMKKHTPINDPLIVAKEVDKSDRKEDIDLLAMGKETKSTAFDTLKPESHKTVVSTNTQMLRATTTKKFKVETPRTVTPVDNIEIKGFDDKGTHFINVNSSVPMMTHEDEKPMVNADDYDNFDVNEAERNLEVIEEKMTENVKSRKKLKKNRTTESHEVIIPTKDVKKDDSFDY
jgi:hypothetical protein